ncbi:MAG: 2-oxo acid dehydrogenase subunit E2 [Bacteroidales bacterium]|nr:2-oxo acid dehydrogenase subunit E2 [Bacteroidales bacterium]
MASVVIMPKQGQSVESCILTEFKKNKGDKVAVGDILFAYETDKASFEEESKVAGTVLAVLYNEGDEIPVLENVMIIGEEGENIDDLLKGAPAAAAEAAPAAPEAKPAAAIAPEISVHETAPAAAAVAVEGKRAISPRAKALAEKLNINLAYVTATGPEGRIIERDIEAAAASGARQTPLAAKIAAETGATAPVSGSGLAGMARSADLGKAAAAPAAAAPAAKKDVLESGADFEVRKLTNIRKVIAKSMHASLQNSAQLTHHLSADARRIQALRKQAKKMLEEGKLDVNITLNDFICMAVIRALKKFPNVNTHFLGDSIKYFNKVHLGLAVDTERGLMVPCVKNADDLSICGLSRQLKEVADACKKGSINPDILSPEAATFTVSNLGNYGVEIFTPIINLPQSAILGVNTIVPRPKDLGGGVYAFVPHIGLSLTYDHRSIDGGEATRFLKQIATEIETLEVEF